MSRYHSPDVPTETFAKAWKALTVGCTCHNVPHNDVPYVHVWRKTETSDGWEMLPGHVGMSYGDEGQPLCKVR